MCVMTNSLFTCLAEVMKSVIYGCVLARTANNRPTAIIMPPSYWVIVMTTQQNTQVVCAQVWPAQCLHTQPAVFEVRRSLFTLLLFLTEKCAPALETYRFSLRAMFFSCPWGGKGFDLHGLSNLGNT